MSKTAEIRVEIVIAAVPEDVWSAVRDVGAIHKRLARGFVTDTKLEGNTRTVTFANGIVVREVITRIDDDARRLDYEVVGGRATHHTSFVHVTPEGGHTRLIWCAEVLPEEMKPAIEGLMVQGAESMKETLESAADEAEARG